MENILRTDCISQRFGGVKALTDISLSIPKGRIFSIIGPNGAGKTTFFNAISGLAAPVAGKVFFEEEEITGLKSFQIQQRGISRTFQNIRLFPEMSVKENVIVGDHSRSTKSIFNSVLRTKAYKETEKQMEAEADRWMNFFGLYHLRHQNPTSLPYGLQRKLEIARAMVSDPTLLLLDEPAAGMNEAETIELRNDILKLSELGTTILLIEHDMKFVMSLSDHIAVLNHGCLLKVGTPKEILEDELVIDAYLGTEVDL